MRQLMKGDTDLMNNPEACSWNCQWGIYQCQFK